MTISIKPLFPVVAVSLGSAETVTTSKSAQGKETKKSVVTHYYGVFTVKTPNKMFLLESVDGDNIVIPKLVELLKLPAITIDGISLSMDLPKTVLTTLSDWFNAPLNELDNVSPYQLHSWGMIDQNLFADTIKRVLAPSLAASGLTMETIETDKVMRYIHLTRATALGVNGDHTPLGDRISSYLTMVEAGIKRADDAKKAELTLIPGTVSNDSKPVINNGNSNGKEPNIVPPLTSFYDGWTKAQLLTRSNSYGLKHTKTDSNDKITLDLIEYDRALVSAK